RLQRLPLEHQSDRVQPRVDRLDSIQVRLHDLAAGCLLLADGCGEFCRSHSPELGGCGRLHLFPLAQMAAGRRLTSTAPCRPKVKQRWPVGLQARALRPAGPRVACFQMDYGRALEFGISVVPVAANLEETRALVAAADAAGLDLVGIQDHPYQRR